MTTNSHRLDINSVTSAAKITLLMLFACTACNKEETSEDPCAETQEQESSLPVLLELVADLSVNEISESDDNGKRTTVGMLSAFFADFSNYNEETIHVVAFGEACVGEVGKRSMESKPEPLPVGEVVFKGLSTNDIALNRNDAGMFEPEPLEGTILSRKGGEEVVVTVSSETVASKFPDFSISALVPPSVELKDIQRRPDGSLKIEWEPADTPYFEIVLTATSSDPQAPLNKINCHLDDDGCHMIGPEAMDWLLSGTNEVRARLKRHGLVHAPLAEGVLAEMDVMRSLEFPVVIE